MSLPKNSNEQNQCKAREIIATSYASITSRFGDIATVPLKEEIVSLAGGSALLWNYFTRHTANIAEIATTCSDYPMKKVIAVTERRLKEARRSKLKQDISLQPVKKIIKNQMVLFETYRYNMWQLHAHLFRDHQISKKKMKHIQNIRKFVHLFENAQDRLKNLNKEDYIAEMEKSPNLLFQIEEAMSPPGEESLLPTLLSIAMFQKAIPKGKRDKEAFDLLNALIYGTQTCVSAMFFLLHQYAYLANNHYLDGDIDQYNTNYEKLMSKFKSFRIALTGSFIIHYLQPLLPMVLQVLEDVYVNLHSHGKQTLSHSVKFLLRESIKNINNVMNRLSEMTIPVIDTTPKNLIQLSFNSSIYTPMGKWEAGKSVSYALQYRKKDSLSKVGDWSRPLKIREKACPILSMPVDLERRQRLIFRRFDDDDKAEFIGILDPSETEFLDVHRDFYNAIKMDSPRDLEVAGILATAGADVEMKFEMGQAPLHAAAIAGKKEFATRFILSKEDALVDLRNDNGYTALHLAAETGQDDFVELLIEHKANANAKTAFMIFTPLHLASRKGSTKSIEILLNSTDTYIEEQDKSGFSALHHAVLGSIEVVELLLSKEDIDANAKSYSGLTPLHLAALNSEIAVAKSLINSQKVQINEGDIFATTPLHYAVMLGHEEMVQYILSIDGVNVNNHENIHQWNALHFAITLKRDNIIPLLLNSSDIDVNAKTDEYATPLHYAVTFKLKKTVEELLAKSADTEVMTLEGYTPLHFAAMLEDSEVLKLLLDHNVNINATANGETALDIAKRLGRENSVALLLEKGAKEKNPTNKRSVLYENYDEFIAPENFKHIPHYGSYLQNIHVKLNSNLTGVKNSISESYHNIPKPRNVKNKKLDSTKENNFFDRKRNFDVTAQFDVLSTLLLLNVLIRKITNKKFIDLSNQSRMNDENGTRNLNDSFKTLFGKFNKISANQQTYTDDAYANMQQNIKRGYEEEIHQALCSNIQNFNIQNSHYWRKLGDAYMSNESYTKHLADFTDGNEINNIIMNFISSACSSKL